MPADLSLLRSPKVIIGGVLLFVVAMACACSEIDDDDDCSSMAPPDQQIFAAGSSGVRVAPPADTSTAALPASGGFGTHLASCGG